MSSHNLSEADLVTYESAAAGHDGVLQSAGGDLVIKPCTQAEVDFYQICAAQNEPLIAYMPKFMGTLQLSSAQEQQALEQPDASSTNDALQAAKGIGAQGTASTLPTDDPGPMKGKKLQTEQSIVLENIAASFLKPNVLDLKLGARLWDDAAPPEKRRRLDDVANKTTSGSLGFRIAGMRVFQADNDHPEGGQHQVFDKLYGRKFDHETVKDGFEDFFGKPDAGPDNYKVLREQVIARVTKHVRNIERILQSMEVRMYSASILIAVEGDPTALASTLNDEAKSGASTGKAKEPADEDEEEVLEKQVCKVVMIDFAHAMLVPGQGPDQNVLTGVTNVLKILEQLN